ncbi:MAG: DciA family protein [Patescibacteria group bacterium]|nr:DciA family protein [Patescibacteria group bacterium]
MDKISGLTKKSFENRNLTGAAHAALVCFVAKKCLEEILKKSFLKEIEIVSFRDGILFISTPNSTYSQEIKLKEGEILKKINLELKKDLVEKIKFKAKKLQATS